MTVAALAALALRPGEPVRFRRTEAGRWSLGHAVGVEKDGSLAIRDGKGASRAIPLQLVEVQAVGPKGGRGWEPLLDRATRTEQLTLL